MNETDLESFFRRFVAPGFKPGLDDCVRAYVGDAQGDAKGALEARSGAALSRARRETLSLSLSRKPSAGLARRAVHHGGRARFLFRQSPPRVLRGLGLASASGGEECKVRRARRALLLLLLETKNVSRLSVGIATDFYFYANFDFCADLK